MAIKFSPTGGDPELDPLARQLAYAEALRRGSLNTEGQMVSGIYVPRNPWQNFVEGFGGSWIGRSAEDDRRGIETAREQQFQDALRRRPSTTMMQDVPAVTRPAGNNPDEEGITEMSPATTRQVNKPIDQVLQEQSDWAMGMGNIRHPLAQSMAAQGAQQAMDRPMRQLERAEKLEAAKQLQEERHQDRLAQITAQLAGRVPPQAQVTYKEDDAGNVTAIIRAPDGKITTETVGKFGKSKTKEGGGAGGAALGKLQNKGLSDTGLPVSYSPLTGKYYVPDENGNQVVYTGKVTTLAQAGGTSAEKKEVSALGDLLDKLNAAEKGLPYASGLGAAVPASIRQLYTDEQTKMADANIAAVSAEKAHELYGAAFTAAEQARAAQFLPTVTGPIPDTKETLTAKLKALRILAEKKKARLAGEPDPYPDMYKGILDGDSSQSAKGTIGATKPAALPKATGAAAVPAAGGGLSAEEQAELERLRAKHGRR